MKNSSLSRMRGGYVGLLPAAWLAALVVGSAATRFKCELVEGQPQFQPVFAPSVTSCSILCSSSPTCEMFAFFANLATPCQLAVSPPMGTDASLLFILPDANVTLVPGYRTSPDCDFVYLPPPIVITAQPITVTAQTITAQSTTTTQSSTTTSPGSTTSASPYVNLGPVTTWSNCSQLCTDEGKKMMACPSTKQELESLSQEIGRDVEFYLDGFRMANTNDFLDASGAVAVALDSDMWQPGSPNEDHNKDTGLTTVWDTLRDTLDKYFPNGDPKYCFCVD